MMAKLTGRIRCRRTWTGRMILQVEEIILKAPMGEAVECLAWRDATERDVHVGCAYQLTDPDHSKSVTQSGKDRRTEQ